MLSVQGPSLNDNLMLDRMSDGFFALDDQLRFTRLNGHAGALAPHRPEALIGKSIWRAFPETVGTIVWAEFRRALENNIAVSFPYYSPCLKHWYEVKAYPCEEGLAVFFHDATDEYATQKAKKSLERAVAFRAEVASALCKSDAPLDAVLRECAEAVVRHADAALSQIWLVNGMHTTLEL